MQWVELCLPQKYIQILIFGICESYLEIGSSQMQSSQDEVILD